ncbi:BglG family transcription antiterminator [Buttiauxella ferragutiae]|uniref:BglG family transcription antiterminator n=1 Tax=Buttiauxella ferragutiae TaxID=82989 RepID=UPI001F534E35|nr:PTS sugar transporter subunit IIA [Buttiauxella ferragutiae]UNK62798.1 PTS sugar transporter subunit IIA [Buttiauxella ferragutiae]
MRLFTNKRIRDIFTQIAQGNVTQTSLAKEMNVSTRTIRSDLKDLNDIVGGFGNSLIHHRKKGFSIQVNNPAGHKTLLEQSQRPWKETRSTAERRRALLSTLLRQDAEISLEELESTWFISIYSLRNDIALLKRHFALYDLSIVSGGVDKFKLSGSEIAFRRCIYDNLLRSKEAEEDYQGIFDSLAKISNIKLALSDYFVSHGLVVSDVNLRFFTLICGITCERILRGSWLLDYEFDACEPHLKIVARDILPLLLADAVPNIAQSEIDYMAMNLAAFCSMTSENTLEHEQHDAERAVMNHFLSYVSSSWFCDVSYDELSRKNLLSHIQAMRIRVNNNITIINPLIEQIKRHYPLMYEMTLAAFSELEHFFSNKISDDEIGYLVMHIGAILEEIHLKDEGHTISALVVNDQGEASTRIVCQKIIRMYPNIAMTKCVSVEQYKAMTRVEESIVISFVAIEEKNKRVINLPPLPERWQLENMKYFLTAENTPPAAMVNYFSADHFFVFESHVHTKESLINFLSSQLELKGRVDEHYLDSVIEREVRASTLLDDKIAIPHPLGLVALSTMVTVAIFPDGIEWDVGKKVKLVYMLAISEDAFVDSMIIYDYLTNILDNDVIDNLSQCENYSEFIALSQKYFL